MKKKLTAKQALEDYDLRFAVQAKLRCSMNTIVAALRGKPSRIRALRQRVLVELAKAGVCLATIGSLDPAKVPLAVRRKRREWLHGDWWVTKPRKEKPRAR